MNLRLFCALFPLVFCVSGFAQSGAAADAGGKMSGDQPGSHEASPRIPRYVTRPYQPAPESAKTAATTATIPMWSATSGTYTYQMVGQSPYTALASPSTMITTPIIPLILTFSDGTVFDPTLTNPCSTAGSAVSLLLGSPIFTNSTYTVGGTGVGSTLYHDFFQRSNFWQYTKPGGVNPNYHLLLSGSTGTAVKITVPAANGQTVTESCGKMGEVSFPWLDNYLLTTAFPQLASNGVLPSQLPVFLLSNVAMYQSSAAECCVLGFHSAFDNPSYSNTFQAFVVGDFDTTGTFGATKDASALSHEIGELINDPTGTNPTPPWGNIGEITGCSSLLEVGDPLTNTDIAITMSNNYTYHVQELAFLSWFYRQSPSIGINGWYSSNGTFKTGSAVCNPTTTTLSVSPTTLLAGGTATVTATVAPTSGAGTPTGTVALVSSTGTTIATYTLSSGSVNATTTSLPAGTYTVTGNYSGDTSFSPSSSAAVPITVGSPSLSFSPISLTFPSQALQTASMAQSVKLTNGGTAALTGIAISLAGASPGDYSQTNTCGSSLAVSANCSVSVTFKPAAAGARTAAVSVADNAGGSPQTVALSGTGVAAAPAVSLSSTALAFGSVVAGVAATSQTVTLTNSGTAALSIASVVLGGTNASDFSDTTTCPGSIAAKAACTVAVTFKPTALGARSATITIADNAAGASQTVALTGTGISPVTLSATSFGFGIVVAGSRSASQKLTLTNAGSAALSIISVSISGTNAGDFSDTTTCAGSLAANGACTVTITFAPTAIGSRTGIIALTDSAPGSPQSVSLTGTGSSPLTLSASSLAFGSVASGTKSTAQTLTITNSGAASLSVTGVTVAGLNPSDFTSSNTCGTSLAAGAKCAATVTFSPASKTAFTATLSIADGAVGSPQTVTLTGTGK